MTLAHILRRADTVKTIHLEGYRADQLQRAARFWVGNAAAKFRKDDSLKALTDVLSDPDAGQRVFDSMSKAQQQVVSIYARYGPTVSGALISAELRSRGLIQDPEPGKYVSHRADVVNDLRDKLALSSSGSSTSYYSSSWYQRRYPTLTLHPALAAVAQPIAPMSWKPSAACGEVQSDCQRSATEVVLDLWRVAWELVYMGSWKTNKGGTLTKTSQNRLRKLVPLDAPDTDPMSPPDPQSLYYELLRGIGCLAPYDEPYDLRDDLLDQHVAQPIAMQAWRWVRAWLHMHLWQDGIGVVPDRDSQRDPVRIEPSHLYQARELLVWGLCRVAHSDDDWLDLETFLKDLWQATPDDRISFYWGRFTWDPAFEMGRRRDRFPSGDERLLAFWLAREGTWAANAIMVTLVTLGLVERGRTRDKAARFCFRLTDLGRAVFGAPELEMAPVSYEPQFLTVQPNFDVLVYVDQAEAARVCDLARFAAHASNAGGQVRTFTLQRDMVYGALESGLSLDEIESFLNRHSRTPLPDNVTRMLAEWAGKRESLVLRTDVSLACSPDGHTMAKGRAMGDGMTLLPKMSDSKAKKDYPQWYLVDHRQVPQTWTASELGLLCDDDINSVAYQRLSEIAEHAKTGWQLTPASIARARQQGVTVERLIDWLHAHLSHDLPPVLELAIRNWTGRAEAFAGRVHLLQIADLKARDAILGSAVFEPLLAAHIPPDWFVVHDAKAAEVKRLLKTLGFAIREAYQALSLEASRQAQQIERREVAPSKQRSRARR